MPSSTPVQGVNDLATLFPDIAKDADGWDPQTVTFGSAKKKKWRCPEFGHSYEAAPKKRTGEKTGCPYCANRKILIGFNDLGTTFPDVAKEADGWDPQTVTAGSNKSVSWQCAKSHTWITTVNARISNKSGCPYCANQKILIGFNDLGTTFPDIAKEADGWDPQTVVAGSDRMKKKWRCSEFGHSYKATPYNRTAKKSGCPYCSNQKILIGFNDLGTTFPDVAKEADGWDPRTLVAGSDQKKKWRCSEFGHSYEAKPCSRTFGKTGCPYCSNRKLLIGFNDLKTQFPDIAEEADGWDPQTVISGSAKSMPWICKKGHKWKTTVDSRTSKKTGCPTCAETGFNPDLEAWFYLMHHPKENQQQIGITNYREQRLKRHKSNGWFLIKDVGPYPGRDVFNTEKKLKRWLKLKIGVVPGTYENWYTSNMKVNSLKELKEISGIDTTIF